MCWLLGIPPPASTAKDTSWHQRHEAALPVSAAALYGSDFVKQALAQSLSRLFAPSADFAQVDSSAGEAGKDRKDVPSATSLPFRPSEIRRAEQRSLMNRLRGSPAVLGTLLSKTPTVSVHTLLPFSQDATSEYVIAQTSNPKRSPITSTATEKGDAGQCEEDRRVQLPVLVRIQVAPLALFSIFIVGKICEKHVLFLWFISL